MINIKEVNSLIKKDINHLDEQKINIKSFKKDRQITIYLEDEKIVVEEAGFEHETYYFYQDDKQALKQIKKLINKEFPRSNKLWYSVKKNK